MKCSQFVLTGRIENRFPVASHPRARQYTINNKTLLTEQQSFERCRNSDSLHLKGSEFKLKHKLVSNSF